MFSTMNSTELLTPGEVATIYGVDPKTVVRWIIAGKVRGFKTPGGQYRIRLADLQAFLGIGGDAA